MCLIRSYQLKSGLSLSLNSHRAYLVLSPYTLVIYTYRLVINGNYFTICHNW